MIPYHRPGVTYNGLHRTDSPTTAGVATDLATTKAHFDRVRTYYPQYGGGRVDVGRVARDADVTLLLGLFLFDGHPDWVEGDYTGFVKPAVQRGNVEGILIGNEDPQMIANGILPQYLKRAKTEFPQTPVGTSQTSGFWLSDGQAGGLLPLVDFIGVNIYPAWDWGRADANGQPIGVTPEAGFSSFTATYGQIRSKYPDRQIVVTETGWPTTYGKTSPPQPPVGIRNAHDYLERVTGWAAAEQVVVFIHNMFDDQYGVDPSSEFNYNFGLIDYKGNPKGTLF
jgi:exo-beta-1,3-glucanase (GH17 family)